jgi:membrane protein YdbS with pleckstrin-like domain
MRAKPKGWMSKVLATQAHRTAVVTLALVLSLVIQVLNLLDVFDGAPTEVGVAVIAIQVLLLAVMVAVSVLNLRERRSRPDRR